MAKQISQETFDDVVRENMQEFDMTAEEALEDAVKQFESQVKESLRKTEKTGLWGFRTGLTQSGLYSHRRRLEA